ncbi:MAG TPA: hypothetical protein VK638_00620 [Edaphobacter sp.]|nr:hypothetical protein [Edaphobacter sp.]
MSEDAHQSGKQTPARDRLKELAEVLWTEECAMAALEGKGFSATGEAYIAGYKAALEAWRVALGE